jgi:hypothetical protein
MIKFKDLVPSIYTSASRDFQYLSWLINIVLNDVKHNVDSLYNLPNTKDPRLTELLAMTLGFKVRRNYDQKQLIALVSIIPSLLKYKGTKKAVVMAIETLMMVSGVSGEFNADSELFFKAKDSLLEVTLPQGLIDINLFMDILPYILPAGMTCRVNRKNQATQAIITKLTYRDIPPKAGWHKDLAWDSTKHIPTGLASMYIIPDTSNDQNKQSPAFTNYIYSNQENPVLNVGLLDNALIPVDPSDIDIITTTNTPKEEEN